MDMPTAVDNCSEADITFSDSTSPGFGSVKYILERTFEAMDAAGNLVTQIQTITVEDTTPPAFTSVPEDFTVECSADIEFGDAEAKTCAVTSYERRRDFRARFRPETTP